MNLSKVRDVRQWRKWYRSGSVPQTQYPAGSLEIVGTGEHFAGPAAGHQTLSLGSVLLSEGNGWKSHTCLCYVIVPTDERYNQVGLVLDRLPSNAVPVELFFPQR